MSGGLEMERIHGDGGGDGQLNIGDIAAQSILGDSSAVGRISSSGSSNRGGGSSPKEVLRPNCTTSRNAGPGGCNSGSGGGRKQRRLRKHFHQQNHKKQNHGKKRIRRNTQPAPNNTNEFLMEEHVFHLDIDNEEGDEFNNTTAPHSTTHGPHAFYSSSDDDEDYLTREFSATYDNVNAERLSSMTKVELISEYQLLQERVESLERELKTALDMRTEVLDPSVNLLTLSDDERFRVIKEEILKLRNENQKVKSDNKYLRKLMYGPPFYVASSTTVETEDVEFADPDADQVSTDSGGGSGSVG